MIDVKAIIDVSKQAAAVNAIEVGGLHYSASALKLVPMPETETLRFKTLQGIVDAFAVSGAEFISVPDVNQVLALGGRDEHKRFGECARSTAQVGDDPERSERQYSAEQLIVQLLRNFEPNEGRDELLNLIGNVKNEVIVEEENSGASQNVIVSTKTTLGKSGSEYREIRNPYKLKPIITFAEIPAPEVEYILRAETAEKRIAFKLIPLARADWKSGVINQIKAWISERLPGVVIAG